MAANYVDYTSGQQDNMLDALDSTFLREVLDKVAEGAYQEGHVDGKASLEKELAEAQNAIQTLEKEVDSLKSQLHHDQ